MRVAVVGAGGLGACVALELAAAGVAVDVFERLPDPLRGASWSNEGKIHQGLIYAKDRSLRTARLMAAGAVTFRALLGRWIDVGEDLALSTPFHYGLHRGSMLSAEAVEAHMKAVCRQLSEVEAALGTTYLGLGARAAVTRCDPAALGVDPAAIPVAWRTCEHAVDPRDVAARLAARLRDTPRLTLVTSARIAAVTRRADGRFALVHGVGEGGRQVAGPYDQVVNAAWEDRLRLDRGLGLPPPGRRSFRHKFGSRVRVALDAAAAPSLTLVLGPFGDVVNFGSHGLFLSWYPAGMVGMWRGLGPPEDWDRWSRAARIEVFRASRTAWVALCPSLAALCADEATVDPVSGIIYALGDTDIDDATSRLHMRDEIGVRSRDGYHSVDTGKYTVIPLLACRVADRVLGRSVARPWA